MEQEELHIIAKGVIRDCKPSTWDSTGLAMYKQQAKVFCESDEDVLSAWKHVIDQEHKAFSYRYRRYAEHNGVFAQFDPEEEKRHDDKAFAADISTWEEVRIKRIERVDGILKFLTENNKLFQMNVEDVYSQLKFRQAFTLGTSLVLPAIQQTSYDRFIASFKITVIEDIGTTIREKIEEIFFAQRDRLRTSGLETERETIDTVQAKGFALYQNRLFFKMGALHTEMKKTAPNISTGVIASALRDLRAENLKHRSFNLWKYELPAESPDDDEPIYNSTRSVLVSSSPDVFSPPISTTSSIITSADTSPLPDQLGSVDSSEPF